MDIAGSRVLVTGASKGIGEEFARQAAAAGADVVLAARSAETLASLAGELGGTARPIDLSDPSAVDGFVASVEAEGGPIDLLINNAGIEMSNIVFDELDEDTIVEIVTVNLVATMRLTRQVLPGMIERGRGHIVNISSAAGVVVSPGSSVYNATKAAITHFSASLVADLKGTPIHVTNVEPGPVDTEMWDRFAGDGVTGRATRRVTRLQLYPKESPHKVVAETLDAVAKDKRYVRFPKRLLANYWLENAPRRITELVLSGISEKR